MSDLHYLLSNAVKWNQACNGDAIAVVMETGANSPCPVSDRIAGPA